MLTTAAARIARLRAKFLRMNAGRPATPTSSGGENRNRLFTGLKSCPMTPVTIGVEKVAAPIRDWPPSSGDAKRTQLYQAATANASATGAPHAATDFSASGRVSVRTPASR